MTIDGISYNDFQINHLILSNKASYDFLLRNLLKMTVVSYLFTFLPTVPLYATHYKQQCINVKEQFTCGPFWNFFTAYIKRYSCTTVSWVNA